MYNKEELREIRTQFWADFKKHMQKHRSANGRKMNWINYPSEVENIFIRLHAENHGIAFSFDIQGKDAGIRAIVWEQMTELKIVLESEMGTDGIWLENTFSNAIPEFSSIRWEQDGLRFSNPIHQKAIFDFFEDRLLKFDVFYQDFKEILITLTD